MRGDRGSWVGFLGDGGALKERGTGCIGGSGRYSVKVMVDVTERGGWGLSWCCNDAGGSVGVRCRGGDQGPVGDDGGSPWV